MVQNPILTIAIPTFERDRSLKECLELLKPILTLQGQKIELLILDNASSDETPVIVNSFLNALPPDATAKGFRHPSNIGMSENILACVERASGEYFMFIGDDDTVNAEGIRAVLELLQGGAFPSAIIQGSWPSYEVYFPQTRSVQPSETIDYFFFSGNAWATISRTSFLREALVEFRNVKALRGNIWPQTFLIFHAMFSHPESPPLITSFRHGEMINARWLVRPEKKYMVRIVEDLLDVAIALGRTHSTLSVPRALFTGPTLKVFEGLLRSLIRISLRDLDRSKTWGVFWKLARHRIPVPGLLKIRVLLAQKPRLLMTLTVVDLLLRGGFPLARRFLLNRSAQRSAYLADVLAAPQTGLRVRGFH